MLKWKLIITKAQTEKAHSFLQHTFSILLKSNGSRGVALYDSIFSLIKSSKSRSIWATITALSSSVIFLFGAIALLDSPTIFSELIFMMIYFSILISLQKINFLSNIQITVHNYCYICYYEYKHSNTNSISTTV